jgi:hypothetical protein
MSEDQLFAQVAASSHRSPVKSEPEAYDRCCLTGREQHESGAPNPVQPDGAHIRQHAAQDHQVVERYRGIGLDRCNRDLDARGAKPRGLHSASGRASLGGGFQPSIGDRTASMLLEVIGHASAYFRGKAAHRIELEGGRGGQERPRSHHRPAPVTPVTPERGGCHSCDGI